MTWEEAKDKFAQQQNFKDWADYEKFAFHTRVPHNKKDIMIKCAAELYAKSKWEEGAQAVENEAQELGTDYIRPAFNPLQ